MVLVGAPFKTLPAQFFGKTARIFSAQARRTMSNLIGPRHLHLEPNGTLKTIDA